MNSRADQNRWRELVSRLLASPDAVRVAVLAAHPDDESIGASSLLSRNQSSSVIYLTDGAPRDRQLWPPDFQGKREEYAAVRRGEAMAALSHAGVTEDRIHWLGIVDQEAVFRVGELARELAERLRRQCADLLITHPYEGGHPDHDTAAFVARLAVAKFKQLCAPILVEMTSYHARESQSVMGEFLNGNSTDEICYQLTASDRHRKQKMFDAYASQRLVLGAFHVTQERWRGAPEYDFSRPPHAGKLWYECMGWPMTGEKWRVLAAENLVAMQEHSCR